MLVKVLYGSLVAGHERVLHTFMQVVIIYNFISSIKHGNALCTVKGRGINMITYIIRLNSKMVAHKTQ